MTSCLCTKSKFQEDPIQTVGRDTLWRKSWRRMMYEETTRPSDKLCLTKSAELKRGIRLSTITHLLIIPRSTGYTLLKTIWDMVVLLKTGHKLADLPSLVTPRDTTALLRCKNKQEKLLIGNCLHFQWELTGLSPYELCKENYNIWWRFS